MAEALRGAGMGTRAGSQHPRSLSVLSKWQGTPQLHNGPPTLPQPSGELKASVWRSMNSKSGIITCSQKRPRETFGNKKKETLLHWEQEVTPLAAARETQTEEVTGEKRSCPRGTGSRCRQKGKLDPKRRKASKGTQGKLLGSSEGWGRKWRWMKTITMAYFQKKSVSVWF